MSADLTDKLPKNGDDGEILTAIRRLEQKVDGLEKKVDERLHDTRPIWHKVVADIAQLQTGQETMRAEISEITNTLRNVNRDQIVINDSVRRIQMDFLNFNELLHRLVVNRNPPNSST